MSPASPIQRAPIQRSVIRRSLTALPVYNEARHVTAVLDEVKRYADDVLVVDDGSSDGTGDIVQKRGNVHVVTHPVNRGYGAALRSAFQFAMDGGYDAIVTIDCDGQHEPCRIPQFVEAVQGVDMVSGSRYLKAYPGDSTPPEQRRRINEQITGLLNQCLGLSLTDAFCGFKAYRVDALRRLSLTDDGYAMPIELWVQAVCAGLEIIELPVPLIYLDEARSFGGSLDDANTRLKYYHEVLERSIEQAGPLCAEQFRLSTCGEGGG